MFLSLSQINKLKWIKQGRWENLPYHLAGTKPIKDGNFTAGVGEKGTITNCSWECKLAQLLWKTVWSFLKKSVARSSNPCSGQLPEKIWKPLFVRISVPTFTAALFTVAMTWGQPKGPPMDDWIKKMRYTYTVEYYSAVSKDGILPFATTWVDLERVSC